MSEMTDRERALITGLTTEAMFTFCPYEAWRRYQMPLGYDADNPRICEAGCWDEPCSAGGPYALDKHPDLRHAAVVAEAWHRVDSGLLDDGHPLLDWALEHEPKTNPS